MVPRPDENKDNHNKEQADFVVVDEQTLWAEMDPMAWHKSVVGKDSVFTETYHLTRSQIAQVAVQGKFDVILEVGCGTGDVIGNLGTLPSTIPRIGIDINERFIEHCQEHHSSNGCHFQVLDVLDLAEWWTTQVAKYKYKKPLVFCVNNTLPIMPFEIRSKALQQMLQVCGKDGRLCLSFWNGHYFSHAVMNFYMTNAHLCGTFDVKQHVDFEGRALETPTGYQTHWMTPVEVQKLLRSYDVNIARIVDDPQEPNPQAEELEPEEDNYISRAGLAIFAWFGASATSNSKKYYDSDDAQTFYSAIWGEETVHIGRYDLLTASDKTSLTLAQQIGQAQALHEDQFVQRIRQTFQKSGDKEIPKMRLLDMGCGYAGLLRRLWKHGLVWRATGCDLSAQMCHKARLLNEQVGAAQDIQVLEESYLSVSIPNESVDLVISMDALLHIGPDGHAAVAKEAHRCLRPGGWMIFCDIMQQESVDATEMQPIYDRIHLSKLGTVSNYGKCLEQAGFSNFSFEPHSSNVATHYGMVRQVLQAKQDQLDLSPEFVARMSAGLATWETLAPKNIVWGFVVAQKTAKAPPAH